MAETGPGVARGHGDAEADRLRAELEELTGKPVQLHMVQERGPRQGARIVRDMVL
jgi:hypothetical protein